MNTIPSPIPASLRRVVFAGMLMLALLLALPSCTTSSHEVHPPEDWVSQLYHSDRVLQEIH